MKSPLILTLVVLVASTAVAEVSMHVYLYDGQTPLPAADPNAPNVCRDVMVGTRLVVFLSSDAPGKFWNGALLIPREQWATGALEGRGYNPTRRGYDGSCLPAAGKGPYAEFRTRPATVGFDLTTGGDAVPGDWFVLDYRAVQRGPCTLRLHDYKVTGAAPIDVLTLNHVASRDFNADTIVDWRDFTRLANHWQTPPPDPNVLAPAGVDPNTTAPAAVDPNALAAVDLNADARIDFQDILLFSDFWLERTDNPRPPPDPNTP